MIILPNTSWIHLSIVDKINFGCGFTVAKKLDSSETNPIKKRMVLPHPLAYHADMLFSIRQFPSVKVGLDISAEKRFCRIWRLQTQMGYLCWNKNPLKIKNMKKLSHSIIWFLRVFQWSSYLLPILRSRSDVKPARLDLSVWRRGWNPWFLGKTCLTWSGRIISYLAAAAVSPMLLN